jgi:hypothetical protein
VKRKFWRADRRRASGDKNLVAFERELLASKPDNLNGMWIDKTPFAVKDLDTLCTKKTLKPCR